MANETRAGDGPSRPTFSTCTRTRPPGHVKFTLVNTAAFSAGNCCGTFQVSRLNADFGILGQISHVWVGGTRLSD